MIDATFPRMARRMGLQFDQIKADVALSTPLRRQRRPADIAAAVAFLCSDDASLVTG